MKQSMYSRLPRTEGCWHKECAYAYFWENVDGIGKKSIEKMYQHFHSYETMYLYGETFCLKETQQAAFQNQKRQWEVEKEYHRLLSHKIWCIPRFLRGYPDKLQQVEDAPSALFVKGKLPDESLPAVAVVGARNCSPYGRSMAKELGRELAANGIQVISGLARGIDGIAQQSALEEGGASFGILGCGVDICYPEENRALYEKLAQGENGGGIISEWKPSSAPAANHFPVRNRIISGLADALVVVEAKEQSGTFITVTSALEQGKDVYVIPGRIGDRLSYGCNRLIAQGAGIIYDRTAFVEEIKEKKNYVNQIKYGKTYAGQESASAGNGRKNTSAKTGRDLEERERKLLALLDIQYQSLEKIMEELPEPIPVQELLAALSGLEFRGLIEAEGSFYRKK